jgi:twitching motility protein PilT
MTMNFNLLLDEAKKIGASDIHLVAGSPPAFRVEGLIVLHASPALDARQVSAIVSELLTPSQKAALERDRTLWFSLFKDGVRSSRVSLYYSGGSLELAARVSEERMRSPKDLNLPPFVDSICWMSRGLVIVTGPTGVGKTTTLNYIIDHINAMRSVKILTIEDPVEFTHKHKKSLVVQQEVGLDVRSFQSALEASLRLNPDVIVIGEMRDLETIQTALVAAETGHLVLTTLHTPDAVGTIDRMIGVFPAQQREQIRTQLANTLQAVVAQKLLPRASGKGRVLACEILTTTGAVRNHIREGHVFKLYSAMQTSQAQNMQTMDAVLFDQYQKGVTTYETARSNALYPENMHKSHYGSIAPARTPGAPAGPAAAPSPQTSARYPVISVRSQAV